MSGFRHILVATDFGDSSARALEFALRVASRLGADLTLVHACELDVHAKQGLYPGVDAVDRITRAARDRLETQLGVAREVIPGARIVLRQGVPRREVLAAIQDVHPDLVVLGTHGRTGIERAVLGSVAERIVRLSPVPTLVVP